MATSKAKRAEIEHAAEQVLSVAGSIKPEDVRPIRYALERVRQPISGGTLDFEEYSESDRDTMYAVLVYRINKNRPTNHKLYLKEL